MTMQHKRGIDKGEGFDGAIADITRPTSHMLTVEASLTEIQCAISHQVFSRPKVKLELCKLPDFRAMVISLIPDLYQGHPLQEEKQGDLDT